MGIGVNLPRGFSVFLDYQYTMTHFVDDTSDRLHFPWQRHPLRLGTRWRWRWRRVELGASLAVSATIVVLQDIPGLEDHLDRLAEFHGRQRVVVAAVPMVTLRLWLAKRLALDLGLGARIPFNASEYTALVEQGGSVDWQDISPWPVQPLLMVGVTTEVL